MPKKQQSFVNIQPSRGPQTGIPDMWKPFIVKGGKFTYKNKVGIRVGRSIMWASLGDVSWDSEGVCESDIITEWEYLPEGSTVKFEFES